MKFMFDLMPYLCNSVSQNHSNAFILRPVTLYTSQKISYRVTNGLYERAVRRKGYDTIGRYPCSLAESDTRKIFVSKTVDVWTSLTRRAYYLLGNKATKGWVAIKAGNRHW